MLLEAHKVPAMTFIQMQQDMLNDLDEMLESSDTARRVLPLLSGPGRYHLVNVMLVLHLKPSQSLSYRTK